MVHVFKKASTRLLINIDEASSTEKRKVLDGMALTRGIAEQVNFASPEAAFLRDYRRKFET